MGEFGAGDRGDPRGWLDPGDGEWVGHPEGDRRKISVDVGAGRDVNRAREVEGNTAGFAWEGFDQGFRPPVLQGHVEV